MTRITVPQPIPTTPRTVRLGELAIAAGMTGRPVTLCYQEFPAPLLSEVWRHHIATAGPEAVHHIRTQSDLNKLPERLTNARLVLVHTPRFHIPTSWSIQLARRVDGELSSLPAVFSRFVPENLDEDPGASLVVRATVQENDSITHWLARRHNDSNDRLPDPGPRAAGMPAWLTAIMSAEVFERFPNRPGFRDLEVFRGLLAGACVLRASGTGETEDPAEVSQEDYERVRHLLQSSILQSADVVYDRLATIMVGRANVYLAAGAGEIRRYGISPFGPQDDNHGRHDGPGRDLITRRELCDLGNVRSGVVRRLVDYLHQGADGHEWYCRMGLVRRAANRSEWSTTSLDSLVANLRPWSEKQVRTHFDRLRRDGLITAERDHGNGPWRYELPEELTDLSSPFHALPPAQGLVQQRDNDQGDT